MASLWGNATPAERYVIAGSLISRVLVVADEAATSDELRDAITRRAREGSCRFTLLVPITAQGPHSLERPGEHRRREAEAQLTEAVPMLSAAAGRRVVGMLGGADPLSTIEDALEVIGYDEIILATPADPVSPWLRLDLPRKVRALGLPVTEVLAELAAGSVPAA